MRKIRRECFETNSSSTHAICIPNSKEIGGGFEIIFQAGDYGCEDNHVDQNDYLYTAICELYANDEKKRQEVLNHIREVCSKHNIDCLFVEPRWRNYNGHRYLDSDYGIDHYGDLHELIDILMKDENLLERYIAGAQVFTGNDNGGIDRIEEIIADFKEDGYYVFEKGN